MFSPLILGEGRNANLHFSISLPDFKTTVNAIRHINAGRYTTNKKTLALLAGLILVLTATRPLLAADVQEKSHARQLAIIRHEQALAWTKLDGVQLPANVEEFFRAAQQGTWASIRAPFRSATKNLRPESAWLDDLMVDVYGAYEQEHLWHPDLLQQFAESVLQGMPDQSIYFGGTDPGRFAVTAFNSICNHGKVFVLTQNQLSNGKYVEYANRLYPSGIWLPNSNAVVQARSCYEQDVERGLRPRYPGPEGAIQIMEINRILAKEIFDRNLADHQFFIEESYLIDWMLPYLEPHGLVMKLTTKPSRSISKDVVKRDRSFWDQKERELLADQRFIDCPAARRAYSKCRSAIGGLYATRRMNDESEYAFRQAIRLYPLSKEAYYRLLQAVLLPQARYNDALVALRELRKAGPDVRDIAYHKEKFYGQTGEEEESRRFEKREKDEFNRTIDEYIDWVTKEIEKRIVPERTK